MRMKNSFFEQKTSGRNLIPPEVFSVRDTLSDALRETASSDMDKVSARTGPLSIHARWFSHHPTFSLNFCISFSLDTFSMTPPRLLSFSSNRSYPLWI